MLLSAAALLAVMLVASAAPAMANDWGKNHNDCDWRGCHHNDFDDNDFHNDGLFDDGCIGTTMFGHCTGVGGFDDDFFDDNNDDELDTIDVGDDVECLVEDGDDIDFCVNEETGDIFNV
jgi:hypothetical protein